MGFFHIIININKNFLYKCKCKLFSWTAQTMGEVNPSEGLLLAYNTAHSLKTQLVRERERERVILMYQNKPFFLVLIGKLVNVFYLFIQAMCWCFLITLLQISLKQKLAAEKGEGEEMLDPGRMDTDWGMHCVNNGGLIPVHRHMAINWNSVFCIFSCCMYRESLVSTEVCWVN